MLNKIKFIFYTFYVSAAWHIRKRTLAKTEHSGPIHLFFCMTDHYEPGTGGVDETVERAQVDKLLDVYPKITDKHQDADGRKPTRTWFFPPHYHRYGSLKKLVDLSDRGYGEIEVHLHHGKHTPDTAENLRETLDLIVEEYSQFGVFGEVDGERKYGFIHGDWALANSRCNQYCGVNNEIDILRETGCYADYTHPSRPESTPRQMNTIHYAKSWTDKPKSYNRGELAQVSKPGDESDQLLLIQGPLHPLQLGSNIATVRPIGDEIAGDPYTTKERIKRWVESAVHVEGKRDWVFIKTHTHGATDAKYVLGQEFEDILTELETNYNDGEKYILHYVTAREMYNLVKAAEDGKGDEAPITLMDYKVSKPKYDTSCDIEKASQKLDDLVYKTYRG